MICSSTLGHPESIQHRLLWNHSKEFVELAQKVVCFVSLSQKSNLRIGFRCHSGRHRSVATAELLSLLLKRLVTAVKVVHLSLLVTPSRECTCEHCQLAPTTLVKDVLNRLVPRT